MRVEESVRTKLIANFKSWLNELDKGLKEYIEKMEKAKSVEDLMAIKRDLLLFYVNQTPTTAAYCYFCILYRDEDDRVHCERCEYARYHGVCEEAGSDWRVLDSRLLSLLMLVQDRYYKGEIYNEP